MANLKRNMIELVTDVKGDEVVTEKYWTPPFIPLSLVYEAVDLSAEMEEGEKSEREMIDILLEFVANRVYNEQFTKQQLIEGLHAPDAIGALQDQVMFIAQGQQTDETKNYLAKKKK